VNNRRAPGQVLVGFWADERLVQALDAARGTKPRSQFLRDALAAYCAQHGVSLPPHVVLPPDRVRKRKPPPAAG
jgi:hypothetical protein